MTQKKLGRDVQDWTLGVSPSTIGNEFCLLHSVNHRLCMGLVYYKKNFCICNAVWS